MGVRSRSRVDGAQFALSIASGAAVSLPPPAIATGAMVGEIFVRTAAVVFTRDGTTPTATRGMQANARDIIVLNSRDELEQFQAIAVSTTATLDVEYFTDLSG